MFFLCLRRTLTRGWLTGVASGLGIASADAAYAVVAALGIGAVTAAVTAHQRWIGLAGGLLLVGIGLRTLVAPTAVDAGADSARSLGAAYASIFGLTLANPLTFISFSAAFASVGLGGGAHGNGAVVVGVLVGSSVWWLLLVTAIGVLRVRLTSGAVRVVTAFSGSAIVCFGVIAVVSAR